MTFNHGEEKILISNLLKEKNIEICFYSVFYHKLIENNVQLSNYKTFDSHECLKDNFDYLISIGGDGTILRPCHFRLPALALPWPDPEASPHLLRP